MRVKDLNSSTVVHLNLLNPYFKLPTCSGSSKKTRELQKNIYFCFTNYTKAFDCVDHNKLWKILQQMGITDHLTCLGKISWRRKWQPTPVFLPGKSHGQKRLVGYSLQGRKESDTTEQRHFLSFFHLTCLLRNLYAGQEATVRTGHGTTNWFVGKGVCQGCILLPCLFHLDTEYIMQNARLD